ncbi:MAG: sulfatase-like hydrolase/transferase [Bacteroidota bacterium]
MKYLQSSLLFIALLIFHAGFGQSPNIVLIVADDIGQQDLAIYGNTFTETPQLDALANTGALFTQGYAAQPICSPTRASIITGSYPARVGMTAHLGGGNSASSTREVIPASSSSGIPNSFPALASMLKSQGYETAHLGKWHTGGSPNQFGYDLVFGGGALPNTYYYPFFNGNPFPELLSYAKEGDFLTDVLTDRAMDFITDQQNETFFLHLNYYAPHVPIEGREDLVEKYLSKADQSENHEFPNPHYSAMVEGIDENVGRLVAHLKSLNLYENTLIVFTSDNGALHVEEVPQFAQHTPPVTNRPLRAGKGHMYEGGTLVPYIFAGYTVKTGQVVTTPVISNDFFNTFAALAGSSESTADGQNIYPLAQGETITDRNLYWHYPHYSPQSGKPMSTIVAGDYKLLKWAERDRIELFDLQADASENFNLVKIQPGIADSLENLLEGWLDDIGAIRAQTNPNYNDNPVSALESFDYFDGDPLEAGNGGIGWVYNWVNEAENLLRIDESSLVYDSISSVGGSLSVDPGTGIVNYSREFLNLVTDEEQFWTSFLINYSETGDFSHSWLNNNLAPVFSISQQSDAFSLINNQDDTSLPFELSKDETHLVVAKVTGFGSSDSVLLWIDPFLGQLPNQADADAILTNLDFSVGIKSIKIEAGNNFSGKIDELKTGFTYGDISAFYTPEALPVDVREPFTYTLNQSIIDKGTDTLGWDGPWENAGNLAGNIISIEAGNLWQQDTVGETQSHLRLSYTESNTQIRIDRTLDQPIISDGSTYWISYWTDTETTQAVGNVANLNLVNSAIAANGGHRLTIGRLFGTGKIGLITPSNGSRSNSNVDDEGLNHLVVRIRTVENANIADTVHLWINPVMDEVLSLRSAAAFMPTPVIKDGADIIRLRVEGAGAGQTPLTVSFDHLRIGRSSEIMSLFDAEEQKTVLSVNAENQMDQVVIYPNPASGKVHFRNLPLEATSMTIYSMNGQKILNKPISSRNSITLDQELKSGIYLVRIRSKSGEVLHKERLIIE